VAPGSRIAVALDREADLVIALLAVLKARCAYVPMDLRYPPDRLRYTVADAGAALVIGDPAALPALDGVAVTAPQELRTLGGQRPGDAGHARAGRGPPRGGPPAPRRRAPQ
jgi:non-ribosomal peptide synthetase component F